MSFSETIFLFLLALVIFGPKKLPEIARQIGKYLNEFKRASNEFKAQIEQEIAHLEVEEKKKTDPPPVAPPEGTAARSWNSPAPVESLSAPVEALPAPAPATLAASSGDHPANGSAPPVATEAMAVSGPAPDAVTDVINAPASQESHA
jgi:sec-independent protein translocase protein TatB